MTQAMRTMEKTGRNSRFKGGSIHGPLIESAPIRKLGICDPEILANDRLMELVKWLERFEAPWLREKLFSEGVFKSAAEFEKAFLEFKRYILLCHVYKEPKNMASKEVDAIWHQFILFTREYHRFCMSFFGRYLHHSPYTSYTPAAEKSTENFFSAYRKTFGDVPSLWNPAGFICDKPWDPPPEPGPCGDCEECQDVSDEIKFMDRISK